MKITSVTGYVVVVPTHPGKVTSEEYGPAVFDEAPKVILEVHTDEGITGIGEGMRGVGEEVIRNALTKLNATNIEQACFQEPKLYDHSSNDMFAHEHPTRPHRLYEKTFSLDSDGAIHVALLDLMGKKTELPAYSLLGGAYRDRVRVDYWMARMTPEDSARVCLEALAKGYQGVKCKCALEDDNVERAEAVREACGVEFKMTFDPNGRFYRFGEAIGMLKRLAAVGNIACVEDPFPSNKLDWFRELRLQGLFPVALHAGYGSLFFDALQSGACDYANIGGLPWNARKASDMCWAAGVLTWMASGIDLGITEACSLHVAAASKSAVLPSDLLGRSIREHNLITNPFLPENGSVPVPQGPGLGVTLDYDAIDRYAIDQFEIQL